MAGSTPVPFEGVSVLLSLSGSGYSSARTMHLIGEHFGIIRFVLFIFVFCFCASFHLFFFFNQLFIIKKKISVNAAKESLVIEAK